MNMKIKIKYIGQVVSYYQGNYTNTIVVNEDMAKDYKYWVAIGLDYLFEVQKDEPKVKYKGVENEH